jgi:hypothetical protein
MDHGSYLAPYFDIVGELLLAGYIGQLLGIHEGIGSTVRDIMGLRSLT